MRNLNWSYPGESIRAEDIVSVEQRLAVKFPEDYIEMISAHSGAYNPDECSFKYLDHGENHGSNFGYLVTLQDEQPQNVFEVIEDLEERLPKHLIPIIGTGSGDFVCLDYRLSDTPVISYFAHDYPLEDSVSFVAYTFSDFLELLTIPEV